MPVIGLPKTLEISLSGILEDFNVTSWNIRGDTDGMQVTIRFKTDELHMDTSNITFRKVPPSQIRRNRDRAVSWRETDKNQPSKCVNSIDVQKPDESSIPSNECAFTNTSDHSNSLATLTSAISSLPDQVDGTCDLTQEQECHSPAKQYQHEEPTSTPVICKQYDPTNTTLDKSPIDTLSIRV